MSAARPERSARPAGRDGQPWGASNLNIRFGGKLVLEHVTLRAAPGEVCVVVGGDGAGKSTLLRCLAGVLPASGGEVHRPGTGRAGYLSPGPGTYPDLTVRENLAFRAAAYGIGPAVAGPRVGQLLERTGLAAARNRLAGQLSGGMRKKLGVIAAMVHQPDLLVLDEPTTGVDPVSRADLWWLIVVAASEGAAVVVSTSYLDEAERATSVLALDGGRVLAAGTSDEIVARMPGVIRSVRGQPQADERSRAWLRGGQWRVWDPAGAGEVSGTAGAAQDGSAGIRPDLQDAVTVAVLAHELETSRGSDAAQDAAMTGGGAP